MKPNIHAQILKTIFMITGALSLLGCVVHDSHRHHRNKKVVVKKGPITRVVTLPGSARVVAYNGNQYYLHNGYFYRAHNKGHIKTRPPAGLSLAVLPSGFVKVKRKGRVLYYYDGVYLSWNAKRNIYIVVD